MLGTLKAGTSLKSVVLEEDMQGSMTSFKKNNNSPTLKMKTM